MTKKPRVDKQRNVWKVAELIAKNPHITEPDLVKQTWLWAWTVHRAKKELEKSGGKDDTIKYIVDASKKRIKRVQRLFDRYLDEIEDTDKLDRRDLQLAKDLAKDDQARVENLWWSLTDENWWMKDNTFTIKIVNP